MVHQLKSLGFTITGSKGFQITFENGWTISIQFGPGNYCNGYGDTSVFSRNYDAPRRAENWSNETAEVAVWDADGKWLRLGDGDTVIGWQTPAQVAEMIARVIALPKEPQP